MPVPTPRASEALDQRMPTIRICVTAVTDEGDTVIVYGVADDPGAEADSPAREVAFVVPAKSEGSADLAERASRLERGALATIEYRAIEPDWNLVEDLHRI